jgi:probable F420-dependent oxidoreductase
MDEHMQNTWYDTVATLGWLAGITANVRLMSHVYVLSYRHPLQTAKSFMTLDELSGGRAILGVGAGHLQGEFALLGLDFADRGPTTDEAIDVIRAAFANEYPDVTTKRYGHVHDAGMAPRPRQAPLPIWVGGSSKPALRRAAERGDGWLPQGTPRDEMPGQIAFLLEHRKRTVGEEPIDLGVVTELVYVGDPGWDVGQRTLSGPPDYIAQRLNEFGAMGVNHLQLRFRSRDLQEQLDQMAAFGTEVRPLLTR